MNHLFVNTSLAFWARKLEEEGEGGGEEVIQDLSSCVAPFQASLANKWRDTRLDFQLSLVQENKEEYLSGEKELDKAIYRDSLRFTYTERVEDEPEVE